MKKNYLKFLNVLVILCIGLSSISCSDEDEDDDKGNEVNNSTSQYSALVTGVVWHLLEIKDADSEEYRLYPTHKYGFNYIFKKDGTCNFWDGQYGLENRRYGTYTINDKLITAKTKMDNGTGYIIEDNFHIIKADKDSLILMEKAHYILSGGIEKDVNWLYRFRNNGKVN